MGDPTCSGRCSRSPGPVESLGRPHRRQGLTREGGRQPSRGRILAGGAGAGVGAVVRGGRRIIRRPPIPRGPRQAALVIASSAVVRDALLDTARDAAELRFRGRPGRRSALDGGGLDERPACRASCSPRRAQAFEPARLCRVGARVCPFVDGGRFAWSVRSSHVDRPRHRRWSRRRQVDPAGRRGDGAQRGPGSFLLRLCRVGANSGRFIDYPLADETPSATCLLAFRAALTRICARAGRT